MSWFRKKRQRRSSVTKHYVEHKEIARKEVHSRLSFWNAHYGYGFNRVAIRNQKTCWGSCTEKGNLNFSYKLIFLPPHLMDYIIVHELCHLKELNHGKQFWSLVAQALPEYKAHIKELKAIEQFGTSVVYLQKVKDSYAKHVSTIPTPVEI